MYRLPVLFLCKLDPIYIDHYLTGPSHTNLRVILQWLPTVFLGRQLCESRINLSIQKTYIGLIWAIHDTATQLNTDIDLALILNRATAYSQKFSLASI